jgi:hypothetical protein
MTVRHFDWRDLPSLHRWRQQSIFLDSSLVLTRGAMIMSGALVSYLAPSTGVFTAISDGNGSALIGQIIHISGSPFSHLTFLTPDTALESPNLPALLDFLVSISGERGALRLLADVDEHSAIFEAMRGASFAIYARQRIWQLTGQGIGRTRPQAWRAARRSDEPAIRNLYNNLVPGLVQQVEPFPGRRPSGMVLYEKDDLLAFVELKYGSRGIWAQPFIHPDAEDVMEQLIDLIHKIPSRRSRPLYICIRSYQSWLEPTLEDIGAEAGPRQAVMVKHLALAQKAAWSYALPALEGGHPEITASIVVREPQLIPAGDLTCQDK